MDGQRAPALPRQVRKEAPNSNFERQAISAKDVYEVPRLAVQGMLAWSLPEAAWWTLSRLFGQVNVLTHPQRTRSEIDKIAAVLADVPTKPGRVALENWANRYEERFHYMRAWRPGGWTPDIEIVGNEHVSAALDKGRGIIFWAGSFSFNDLVAKIAWHRLGLEVSHFSRPIHGFSETRFGIRYLNAVRRVIEDRYLGERLMVEEHETRAALKLMRERLEANGAVSFTVGHRGRRSATAAFLGGRITIATGPLAMAISTGAALLPVYTLRLASRRFEVTIGDPIEPLRDANEKVNYAAAIQSYANALKPFVLRDPGQWRGWHYTSGDAPI